MIETVRSPFVFCGMTYSQRKIIRVCHQWKGLVKTRLIRVKTRAECTQIQTFGKTTQPHIRKHRKTSRFEWSKGLTWGLASKVPPNKSALINRNWFFFYSTLYIFGKMHTHIHFVAKLQLGGIPKHQDCDGIIKMRKKKQKIQPTLQRHQKCEKKTRQISSFGANSSDFARV